MTSKRDKPYDDPEVQRDAWCNFLSSRPWTHVAHLTTRFPMHQDALVVEFKAFVRRLQRFTQQNVEWVYAMEFSTDRPHLHAALFTAANAEEIAKRWPAGNRLVEPYDGPAIIGYMLKQLKIRGTDFDFSPWLRKGA